MADVEDAYKLATEAGREATKQLIVVVGGLLAGYLAFLGRSGADQVLDINYARWVIALLFISLLLATASLGFVYLMHAARSRYLTFDDPLDKDRQQRCERIGTLTTVGAFLACLLALATIVITAIC